MVIRLSDFRNATTSNSMDTPIWVVTETNKKLYLATVEIFCEIEKSIKNNQPLSIRDRQIAARKVALRCGLNPSIVTMRRQPELVKLIESLNEDLRFLYTSNEAKRSTSGRKLTKKELIIENREQKEEISRLKELILVETFSNALEHTLISTARESAITIQKLREKIANLEKVIDNQAEQNRKHMDSI